MQGKEQAGGVVKGAGEPGSRKQGDASRIVLAYVAFSLPWIALSDWGLDRALADSPLQPHLATVKGWLFIAVTAFLLDGLLRRYRRQVQAALAERERALQDLAAQVARIDEEVARRTAELIKANGDLQAFVHAATHDIQAPLRRIASFGRRLANSGQGRLQDDDLVSLDFICRNAERLHRLVDDLLAYARLENQSTSLGPVALPAAVDKVVAETAADIAEGGARVDLHLPALAVLAEPVALEQVLRNLIANALKYSREARPPTIAIGAEADGGCCRLWVRDNGIGFPMADRERIFEPFCRLHGDGAFPGNGIGLALVRRAAEAMGGRVWADSEPGRGAIFYLELQLVPLE